MKREKSGKPSIMVLVFAVLLFGVGIGLFVAESTENSSGYINLNDDGLIEN